MNKVLAKYADEYPTKSVLVVGSLMEDYEMNISPISEFHEVALASFVMLDYMMVPKHFKEYLDGLD